MINLCCFEVLHSDVNAKKIIIIGNSFCMSNIDELSEKNQDIK